MQTLGLRGKQNLFMKTSYPVFQKEVVVISVEEFLVKIAHSHSQLVPFPLCDVVDVV